MIRLSNFKSLGPQKFLGVRHLQCFLLFWGLAVGYAMRVNLSVAIVAMTDPLEEKPYAQVSCKFILKCMLCLMSSVSIFVRLFDSPLNMLI